MLSRSKQTKLRNNQRIIGGESVTRNIYPWVVAIFDGTLDENGDVFVGTFFCGGTILTKNQVLTAARCLWKQNVKYEPENLFVAFGEYDLRSFTEIQNKEWFIRVLKFDIHPKFNIDNRRKLFDAAILSLQDDIDQQVTPTTCFKFQ